MHIFYSIKLIKFDFAAFKSDIASPTNKNSHNLNLYIFKIFSTISPFCFGEPKTPSNDLIFLFTINLTSFSGLARAIKVSNLYYIFQKFFGPIY